MSDSHPMMEMLGLTGPEPAPADPAAEQPSAATPDATATSGAPGSATADSEDTISLDEALAALDGQAAPQTPEPASAEPAAPDSTTLSAEQIAALVAENEQYKAEKAQAAAQDEDAQWDAQWDALLDRGYAFYDAERERIRAIGREQGRTQDEIDLAIYRRVEQGTGLKLPDGTPVLGEREWERQTLLNHTERTREYLAAKSQPSALERLGQQYGLDEADRTALAKFVALPPEHLEELARTLGAKNQRLSSTMSQATTEAHRNVAANLANGITPGSPGAPPPAKRVAIDHTRKSTEYVGKVLGFVR